MKSAFLVVSTAVAVAAAGCSSLDRSRELGNPATSARTIAVQVCAACHGSDGRSLSPNFPNLAAQQSTYLENQLKAFRSHHRSDPAGFEYMWGLSAHLTDEQIKGLAAYYAGQAPHHAGAMTAQSSAEGRTIFEKGIPENRIPACATCHGQAAQGNGQFPRLAGQHRDYLIKQLQVFQRTDERPDGSVMKEIAHSLTPENMQAVASYLEAMP
jgi:cytochrome c553